MDGETSEAVKATKATPKKRLKREEIIAAIKASDGGVYMAASRLHCTPKAIYRRMEKDAGIRAAVENARGELVDLAESKLKASVKRGNIAAIIWVTKTLGKSRGYVERTEHTGADGGAIEIKAVDYRVAIAPLAPGSMADSEPSGESQDRMHGTAVG